MVWRLKLRSLSVDNNSFILWQSGRTYNSNKCLCCVTHAAHHHQYPDRETLCNNMQWMNNLERSYPTPLMLRLPFIQFSSYVFVPWYSITLKWTGFNQTSSGRSKVSQNSKHLNDLKAARNTTNQERFSDRNIKPETINKNNNKNIDFYFSDSPLFYNWSKITAL